MSSSINATTPQLKLLDRFYEIYRTCDLNDAAPLMSKNYVYKSFPKAPGVGDLTKEEHLALFGPMFAKLVKFEVRIKRNST